MPAEIANALLWRVLQEREFRPLVRGWEDCAGQFPRHRGRPIAPVHQAMVENLFESLSTPYYRLNTFQIELLLPLRERKVPIFRRSSPRF